jgi:drug/metabolite transporter (DMT)-like permease
LWPGLLLALLGAIGFSGKAIIVKLAYRHGVDAVTLLMWRMLLALPFFLAMAWWAGRGKPALTRQDWRDIAVLGFSGYYLASYLDFAGLAYISASLERLILYLNPTLVLLISVLFFQHRLRARQVVALAVSYAGVVAVFAHERRLARPWCSAARSAMRSTWRSAARWCSAWARCGWRGWPARWPAGCASRSSCCCVRWPTSPCRRRCFGCRC